MLLLVLSGLTGVILLSPLGVVHATNTPTITLSASTATYGTKLTLTGSGFSPGAVVTISVGTTTITTATTVGLAFRGIDSLFQTGQVTNKPVADADGNFQSLVKVKDNANGAVTVTATDGTSGATATTTFTMQQSIAPSATSKSSGFPGQSRSVDLALHGFATSETITFSSSAFTATYGGCTTNGASSANPGECDPGAQTMTVAEQKGGSKTITATGGNSGLTASTTFTVKTYVAFYNAAGGVTTFSVASAAPTSVLVEGHGFTGSSIAASSATFTQGSTTITSSHATISIANDGTFGTDGNGVVIAASASLPFGNLAFNLGGSTFSWANGNILLCNNAAKPCTTSPMWGGALIGSVAQNAAGGSGTGIAVLDSSSYMPNLGGGQTIYMFGYGFVPSDADEALTITPSSAAPTVNWVAQLAAQCPSTQGTWCFAAGNGGVGGDSAAVTPDANGAVFGWANLGEAASGTYTLTITQATEAPNAIVSPTFSTTAWIDLSGQNQDNTVTLSMDYVTTIGNAITTAAQGAGYGANTALDLHGFTSGATKVSLSAGGIALTTHSAAVGTNGFVSIANDADTLSGSNELAGGTFSLTASDSASTPVTATFSGAITVLPRVDFNGNNGVLYPGTGNQGSTINVRSGSNFGVHGLAASTKYNVTWGIGSGAQVLGSFTTNSVGQIPAPGINVVLPAGTAGFHVLAISAFFNGGDGQITGLEDTAANNACGTGVACVSQYQDLFVKFGTLLIASPSAVSVGGSLAFSGSGLKASTLYVVTIDSTGNGACQLNGNAATGQQYTTVTTTASGALPAGFNLASFPAIPTNDDCEKATQYNAYFSTAAEYPGTYDGSASFVLQASATLNMTTAAAGHAVTITAKGLPNGVAYSVDFGYTLNALGTAFTSQSLGTIVGDTTGSGSASVVIPAGTAQGSYVIQLADPGTTDPSETALVNAPTITVSQTASGSVGTSTFTASGTPAESTTTQGNIVSGTFTNNYGSSLSVYMWVSVMNSAGQTVGVYLGSATVASGASTNIGAALFNLPSGSYTAQVFITTTNGIVASQTSTTASFTV